jgi:signal transduction histidine kinase
MTVSRLRDRLWFRQTTYTVTLGILIGLVLSLFTILNDLRSERRDVRSKVLQVMETVREPAAQAIFNIDGQLALTVVEGLYKYQLIRQAVIVDDIGETLASVSREPVEGSLKWLADLLFDENARLSTGISYPDRPKPIGRIDVWIDSRLMAEQFFQRSAITLLGGLVRNILLSICLLIVFYFTLTKPLGRLVAGIGRIDPANPEAGVKVGKRHCNSELGEIASGLNRLLTSLRDVRRREESMLHELQQHRDRLEELVNERTAELESRNRELQREISVRKETEERLRESRRNALDANRAKSAFLANMSHELRSPLNAILGFTELMDKQTFGPLGDSHYETYVRDVHASGEHLLALVNDLLDLSKIEAGEYEIDVKPVALEQILTFCISMTEQNARQKEISVALMGEKVAQIVLSADERVLKQITLNLLSNAIKFTPAGGSVTVTFGLNGQQAPFLSVKDNGIGMSRDDLANAFMPFRQSSDPRVRSQTGTGLGLPLTRELVELHQGTITIESEPGKGTEVVVVFPPERVV